MVFIHFTISVNPIWHQLMIMKASALFSYRCTYRIELHLKNALHQSTVKAITNTQLLWHHFITVDTLKCKARVVLNILKVKISLQWQAQKPAVAPKNHSIKSELFILTLEVLQGLTTPFILSPKTPVHVPTELSFRLLTYASCFSFAYSDSFVWREFTSLS